MDEADAVGGEVEEDGAGGVGEVGGGVLRCWEAGGGHGEGVTEGGRGVKLKYRCWKVGE